MSLTTGFYIQNREHILGKQRIDLEIDPPPDLAVEIDLTSTTQLEDYQSIGASELWIYRWHQLFIGLFDGQHYQESQTSIQFPNTDVKKLIPELVDWGWQIGTSVVLREFEQINPA